MSYRNPKVYMPDPMALQKGFQQSFQPAMQQLDQALADKRKQIEEAEQAEARLINATDLGPYAEIDSKVQDAFQERVSGIVDANEFVNMSPADKQKTLIKIRNFKSNYEKLGQILQTSATTLDARHDPQIFALKKALAENPGSINVSGEGLDISLSGEGFDLDVNSLQSLQLKDITEAEESYRDFQDSNGKVFNSLLIEQAQKGNYEAAMNTVKSNYAKGVNSLTEDQLAYIYSNKINVGAQDYSGTPEQKQAIVDYMTEDFFSNNVMEGIDTLYKKEVEEQEEFRTKSQIVKDETAQKRVDSLGNLDFMFDLSKRGADYDIHSDTKFINMMSGMGLNTQPVVNQSGDKGFIIQDQVTNNKITIYPESLTQAQLKDQLRSLITSQSTRPILPK